jgi:hypothetical protein
MHHIQDAISRGLTFLAGNQLRSGAFASYECGAESGRCPSPDQSTLCVTAFVAAAISSAGSDKADTIIAKSINWFLSEMRGPGLWSFSPKNAKCKVPLDIDTTALVSWLFQQYRVSFPNNRDLLLANRDEKGRFFLWLLDDPFNPSALQQLFGDDPQDSVVDANIIAYLGRGPWVPPVIASFEQSLVSGEGNLFPCYTDELVLAYGISRALLRGVKELHELRPLIAHMLEKRADARDNVLLKCFVLRSALAFSLPECVSIDAIERILQTQQADGSWPAFPMLQRFGSYFGSRALTTGMCIEVLQSVVHWEASCVQELMEIN